MQTIAALFVARDGCYWNLEGVKCWDKHRDARLYEGDFPVVAHPPCERWSMLAHSVKARYGYELRDDDGCFASALASVESFGGVLEHPAYSMAWDWFLMAIPEPGKWIPCRKGWTCQVAQSAYGHAATKKTWLYYVGVKPPELNWSSPRPTAQVSRQKEWSGALRVLGKKEKIATPLLFRDLLISLARMSIIR